MLADSASTPVVKSRYLILVLINIFILILLGKDSDKGINMNEEKRQREQLLALNQVLAQQVLQKSRKVSGEITSFFIVKLTISNIFAGTKD